MTASDLGLVIKGIAPVVREFVASAVAPIGTRLAAIESRGLPRDGEKGSDGEDGKDADPALILQLQAEITTLRADLSALIEDAPVNAADIVAQLSATLAATVKDMESRVALAVAALPKPKDGQSVSLHDVQPMIVAAIEQSVAALPKPKDGQSVTVEDMAPLIAAEVEKAVAAIQKPKDGVGVLGALIDREGQLVVTLSDGTVKNLGEVVGRDVDMAVVAKVIGEALGTWTRPRDGKDGEPGPSGRDGTLEQLKVTRIGDRTFAFCFKDGTPIEGGDVTIPFLLDRGVYVADKAYEPGDVVSWAGSMWIAQHATTLKPGTADWRLSVKAGRDGKEGKSVAGPKGDPGRDGKDLTQMDMTGRKW